MLHFAGRNMVAGIAGNAPTAQVARTKQSEPRRDPDSGKFISSDAPLDEFEQIFVELERALAGDFT
jgi:hypothetical protein